MRIGAQPSPSSEHAPSVFGIFLVFITFTKKFLWSQFGVPAFPFCAASLLHIYSTAAARRLLRFFFVLFFFIIILFVFVFWRELLQWHSIAMCSNFMFLDDFIVIYVKFIINMRFAICYAFMNTYLRGGANNNNNEKDRRPHHHHKYVFTIWDLNNK